VSDTDLKIAIALVGVLGAMVSAFTSAVLFFWLDGRRRYKSQLSGLRTLLMVIESVAANVRANSLQRAELKLDWFIVHADVLLRNTSTFNLVRELITQVATVQRMASEQQPDTMSVVVELEQLCRDAEGQLLEHARSLKRFFFLTPKTG
jgi:hypothetical protein